MALGLVALFTLASLISLGGSYLVIANNIEKSMRSDLRQELAGFRAAPSAGAIAQLVAAEAAVTDPERRVMSYTAPGGRTYGNGLLAAGPEGFRVVGLDGQNLSEDGSYLALTATLWGGRLTIANSREQLLDLREMFISVLILSLLPTAAIALTGAVVIAARSARRLRALEGTLDRLTTGDLTARVPEMPHAADDLSTIAARVDRMAEAQQTSVSALRQVSADIAHDLKTPIQRVGLLLERLRATPGLSAEAIDLVDRAGRETEGIVSTFQALLQIAQIEGGSPKSRFMPVDLVALAKTLTEVYEPAAEDSDHRLKLAVPKGPLLVRGDKALLGQVLANLIENALRHTPAGSHIDLSVGQIAEGIELCVADDGPGVPAHERKNVLRRLYRLEQSRTTPGSGLGLSMVAVIAELHGARLFLEPASAAATGDDPAQGDGLRVRLVFPLPPQNAGDAGNSSIDKPAALAQKDSQGEGGRTGAATPRRRQSGT